MPITVSTRLRSRATRLGRAPSRPRPPDPAAQAVLFASASDPLIGEEMFAAPAYLNADAAQRASISVQDILRWLIILALLGLSAMKFLGIV